MKSRIALALILSAVLLFPRKANGASACINYPAKQVVSATDYRAVGLIENKRGRCTGSLVARNKVLTAAHCQEVADEFVDYLGRRTRIIRFDKTRDPEKSPKLDIAVATLAYPLMDIEPLSLDTDILVKPTDVLAFVGFGCTQICQDLDTDKVRSYGSGKKRAQYASLKDFSFNQHDMFKIRVCYGDSGGPLIHLRTGLVLGVATQVLTQKIGTYFEFDRSLFAPLKPNLKEITKWVNQP